MSLNDKSDYNNVKEDTSRKHEIDEIVANNPCALCCILFIWSIPYLLICMAISILFDINLTIFGWIFLFLILCCCL
jgi:hypothetical protein